jgi:glucose-6-phosphate isomerase
MISHQKATIEVLKKKGPVRVLEFEELNPEAVGFLMALSFVEVMTIAKLADINPFDQPSVEESKKLVLEFLKQTG